MSDRRIHPLTPDRWDDLVELFQTDSMTRNCWCMATRLSGAELREFKAPEIRKKMFASLVKQGSPGLLAYEGETPVGWIAVGPRDMTPEWNKGRKSSAVESEADATDPACWATTCFFVRSGHRKAGMTAELLEAGIEHAKKNGASRVEACPMSHDDKRSNVGMCVGPLRVFERAGFEKVLERKTGRPLMRLALKKTAVKSVAPNSTVKKKSAPAKKPAPKPKAKAR
jgi:GNAT superfamily N-acetyltransferase